MSSSNTTTAETRDGFHPSMWHDFSTNFHPQPFEMTVECMRQRVNQLKRVVCLEFESCRDNVRLQMSLVETLQHLRIDHLFEEQIGTAISNIKVSDFTSSDDLHEVSLRFRLLRTRGIWVSPDEFNKFRDENGRFSTETTNDPRGLLSLYNAAHLLIHGEEELQEAIIFAGQQLELLKAGLIPPLADQVNRALKVPLPRTLKTLEALNYISEYSKEETYNPSIIELAKLDFNLLQHVHLDELKLISQWWKDLYQDTGLTYSRDRVVECFFWSYTVYYEQEYSRARMMFAKIYCLLSLLDDTYDVHATLDECHKLTEAIKRWDDSAVSIVPEYLRKFYLRLIGSFQDIEAVLQPKEKYRAVYYRKAVQTLSESYLQEAEWFHQNYKPTFEEHVKVSTVSAGGQISSVALLIGMGDEATTAAFEWAIEGASAVLSFGRIARFMNDISSFNSGKNKNDVASSVECYMHEYNVTSEVAMAEIGKKIEDAWRIANKARFEHPDTLVAVQRVTNLITSLPFIYHSGKDFYTGGGKESKETIESLFVTPMPL